MSLDRKPKRDKETGRFKRQLDYQEIAKLRTQYDMSYTEIAHEVGCSIPTVANALKKTGVIEPRPIKNKNKK